MRSVPNSIDEAKKVNSIITNEFIEAMYKAIDDSRWDDLARYFHDQIMYERPGYPPFKGLERVLQFYREERIIASGQHNTEGIVIDGDKAAAWGRFIGRHKNGSELDELYADVYRLEDGRIRTRRSYFFRKGI